MQDLRILCGFIMMLTSLCIQAQVTFSFKDGISDGELKSNMESNVTLLLTALNKASIYKEPLNLSNVQIESEASSRLSALCENLTITCDRVSNHQSCLQDYQGYQIREIPVQVQPKDGSEEQKYRELTISLNKAGIITGVRLAWEMEEGVVSILKKSSTVTDTRERLEILKWVEDFRCYYNEKNLHALGQIYSEDALIITGSVVMQQKRSADFHKMLEGNVSYKVQSKQEYLNKLASVFKNNRKIDVKFDNIEVQRHGSKPHLYGVTLRQQWTSGSYHDEGWLFLMWDFNNPDYPQIYVRTWQPLGVDKEGRPNVYSFPYSN